jgi:hypothetical protein
VQPGIQTVTALLARRPDGTRGLYGSPRCIQTIAEYQSYQYTSPTAGPFPPREGGRGLGHEGVRASELPVKANDHALDATRYALHSALGQRRRTSAYLHAMRRRPEDGGER